MSSIIDQELKENMLESAMSQFLKVQQQTNAQTSQAIQRLEMQLGQMAKELSKGERDEFLTPSPRGHEQLKAVTTLISVNSVDSKVGTDETIQESPAQVTTSKEHEKFLVSQGKTLS
jgi:hypothetical protein